MPFAHHVDGPDALCSWLVRPFVRAVTRLCVCVRPYTRAYVPLSRQRHSPTGKKVKFSHTRYRALGPELIRCTGSQPAGDVK